jgi:hypothetical protein
VNVAAKKHFPQRVNSIVQVYGVLGVGVHHDHRSFDEVAAANYSTSNN